MQRPAAVAETVGAWLGGLLSVAAQSVRLRLAPRGGAAVAAVAGDAPREAGGDEAVSVDLGELSRGEARDVLVDVALPALAAALAAARGGGGDGGSAETASAEGGRGQRAAVTWLEAEVTWLPPGAAEGERRSGGTARLLSRRPEGGEEEEAADEEEVAGAAGAALAIDRQRNRCQLG